MSHFASSLWCWSQIYPIHSVWWKCHFNRVFKWFELFGWRNSSITAAYHLVYVSVLSVMELPYAFQCCAFVSCERRGGGGGGLSWEREEAADLTGRDASVLSSQGEPAHYQEASTGRSMAAVLPSESSGVGLVFRYVFFLQKDKDTIRRSLKYPNIVLYLGLWYLIKNTQRFCFFFFKSADWIAAPLHDFRPQWKQDQREALSSLIRW